MLIARPDTIKKCLARTNDHIRRGAGKKTKLRAMLYSGSSVTGNTDEYLAQEKNRRDMLKYLLERTT